MNIFVEIAVNFFFSLFSRYLSPANIVRENSSVGVLDVCKEAVLHLADEALSRINTYSRREWVGGGWKNWG